MMCASCGTAAGADDDVKLKKCTACHLVRYCSVKCQKDHWPKHKKACKKRAAELRDELLFKQPESTHEEDCPICCHPLPLDPTHCTFMGCCCKVICRGCDYANQAREESQKMESKCAFCRHPAPNSYEEHLRNIKKRIEANDPAAFWNMGQSCKEKGDYNGAFENFSKGTKLGNVEAQFELSRLYHFGQGVEKDWKKELYHLEEAAIKGHPEARHNLGGFEMQSGRVERAVKHYIIAASLGLDDSIRLLKGSLFRSGLVSNEDLAAALRAHQAAVNATKTPQREKMAKYF